jgi:hypothetical protein
MVTTGRAIIHEHLQKVLVELIEDDAGKEWLGPRKTAGQMPKNLLVQYVASTFVLVLNWWAETRSPLLPEEVNDVIRALTLPTLAASSN